MRHQMKLTTHVLLGVFLGVALAAAEPAAGHGGKARRPPHGGRGRQESPGPRG